MGPRSFERGKEALARDVDDEDLASMGPRSFERGKQSSTARPAAPTRRFNGAAFV